MESVSSKTTRALIIALQLGNTIKKHLNKKTGKGNMKLWQVFYLRIQSDSQYLKHDNVIFIWNKQKSIQESEILIY